MIEIGKLHHCTIIVNDLEASRDFYINVLGMKQVERPRHLQLSRPLVQ